MDKSPSEEQLAILEDVGSRKNVMGDCVAGSGKTTTVLFIAQKFSNKKILLVTYNAALKLEVRERASKFSNLRADSYHSMNLFHYMKRGKGNTDKAIRNTIDKKTPLKSSEMFYDILIIDEAQDMKKLFFMLCWKLYNDLPTKPQVIILGDRFQGIYKFMNADPRYLTLCPKIWNLEFSKKTLSVSYRVTRQIASFVNEVMLGETRIEAIKDGPPVSYWRLHPFNELGIVYSFIQQQLNSGNINPGDIFILAASIKSDKSPIRKLENILVQNKIPCYFPTSDEKALDNDVIQDKVVFTTFHSSKGRERKLVIVFGFDSSYYKYYARDESQNVCCDTLYVAATRAKEKLILIQDCLETPLPFLLKDVNEFNTMNYIELYPKKIKIKNEDNFDERVNKPRSLNVTPTELIAFIKETAELSLVELLESGIQLLAEPSFNIDIPLKVETSTGIEDVSMINGIVIPMIQESQKTQDKSTVQKFVENSSYFMKNSKQHEFLLNYIETWDPENMNIENDILLAILYICCSSKLYHKIAQITNRSWLTYKLIRPAIDVLNQITLYEDVEYEKSIEYIFQTSSYGKIAIAGRLDMHTKTTIWEIKCVESLTFEHELQLCIYQWMWKKNYENIYGKRDFKLINIRTGEIREIEHDNGTLDEMIIILLDNKYSQNKIKTDQEFIEDLKDVYSAIEDSKDIYSGIEEYC